MVGKKKSEGNNNVFPMHGIFLHQFVVSIIAYLNIALQFLHRGLVHAEVNLKIFCSIECILFPFIFSTWLLFCRTLLWTLFF